jgi:RNA polymerase sigma-70 factor (ECF subfamily)
MARSGGDTPDDASGDAGDGKAATAAGTERLRAILLRAVERQCPPELASQREDFVQLALLRLLDRTPGEGTRPLRASYLWKVAYTVIIDEIRRVRRQQRHGEALAGGEETAPGPEARTEVQDCLARLQERRRAAVTLYLEGFGTAEVAQAMGWTLKQAENLIYRGVADLRHCLAGGEQ